eukprot:gene28126-biopygen32074
MTLRSSVLFRLWTVAHMCSMCATISMTSALVLLLPSDSSGSDDHLPKVDIAASVHTFPLSFGVLQAMSLRARLRASCVDTHLRRIKHNPGQFSGFQCPRGNGKGVLHDGAPCVGRIKNTHRYLPRNQKKKMMIKKRKVDAPTPPYAQPSPISVSKNVIEAYSPPKVTEVSIMDFISIKPQRTMSKRGFSKQLYVCPVVEQQKPVHKEFPPLPTYHASRSLNSLTPTEPPMALCATEDEEMCAIDVHELIVLCCPDLMMCS